MPSVMKVQGEMYGAFQQEKWMWLSSFNENICSLSEMSKKPLEKYAEDNDADFMFFFLE